MELGDIQKRWLQREKFVFRSKWESYLFLPFSPKLETRVYIYTPDRYNNWVFTEFDPKIKLFNERPPIVEIASGGAIHQVQFDMACLDTSNCFFFKRLVSLSGVDYNSGLENDIDKWAEKIGIDIKRIDVNSFVKEKVLLENMKELILFVRAAQNELVPSMDNIILDFVSKNSRITIAQLQNRFCDIDPTVVVASIAKLMVANKVTMNLSSKHIDRNSYVNPR